MKRFAPLVRICAVIAVPVLFGCSSGKPASHPDGGTDAGADAGGLGLHERCWDESCAPGLKCIPYFDCGDNFGSMCERDFLCDAGPICMCDHVTVSADRCVLPFFGARATACAGLPHDAGVGRLKPGRWLGQGLELNVGVNGSTGVSFGCETVQVSAEPLFGTQPCGIHGPNDCHTFRWPGSLAQADGGPALAVSVEGKLARTVGAPHHRDGILTLVITRDAGEVVRGTVRNEANCSGCHPAFFADAGVRCP